MTTLAEQILALDNGKRTTREIAERVYGKGCHENRLSYVRVVLRQRRGSGQSENDRRYLASSLGQQAARRAIAYKLALLKTGDRDKANKEQRRAYRAARLDGKSVTEAQWIARNVRNSILYHTGDKAAARIVYALEQQSVDRTDASGGKSYV